MMSLILGDMAHGQVLFGVELRSKEIMVLGETLDIEPESMVTNMSEVRREQDLSSIATGQQMIQIRHP
jgi:hypothetical protein